MHYLDFLIGPFLFFYGREPLTVIEANQLAVDLFAIQLPFE
jgi:hypothetical protein